MNKKLTIAMFIAASSVFAAPAFAASSGVTCASLPSQSELQTALDAVQTAGGNGGYGLPMWATLVDSSGRVCAVAKKTGSDPWLGSRVISAQKANTANAFSTDNVSISTANLFSAVQPGGSLYGLQHSNPVNTLVAYRGSSTDFGSAKDGMIGLRVGGVNVFGGGLALYNNATPPRAIGAIGVSGDTSCADHNFAWKLRIALLNKGSAVVGAAIPLGLISNGTNTTDNIVYDITSGASTSGYGHPQCGTPSMTTGGVFKPASSWDPVVVPAVGNYHN